MKIDDEIKVIKILQNLVNNFPKHELDRLDWCDMNGIMADVTFEGKEIVEIQDLLERIK